MAILAIILGIELFTSVWLWILHHSINYFFCSFFFLFVFLFIFYFLLMGQWRDTPVLFMLVFNVFVFCFFLGRFYTLS